MCKAKIPKYSSIRQPVCEAPYGPFPDPIQFCLHSDMTIIVTFSFNI